MKYLHFLRNKYLLTGLVFASLMLFFDRYDVFLQLRKQRELRSLQESEKKLTQQIAETREELKMLKTNPATLEKYAREKYMMKKDNEDLFIINDGSGDQK
jgi:cell division protein DivIC